MFQVKETEHSMRKCLVSSDDDSCNGESQISSYK